MLSNTQPPAPAPGITHALSAACGFGSCAWRQHTHHSQTSTHDCRFDHPEAPPTDLAEAARQLRIATAHDMQRKLATPAPKSKQQKGQQAQQQLGQGQQQGGPPPLDPPQVP